MNKLTYLLLFVFLAVFVPGCELGSDEALETKAELEELDLSGLDIDIQMDFEHYEPVGRDNPTELNEFIGELSKAIMATSEADYTVELTIEKRRTRVAIVDNTNSSTFNLKVNDWTKVGEGKCRSEECLTGRVAQVVAEAPITGAGECSSVWLHRVLTGASVEWRSGDC